MVLSSTTLDSVLLRRCCIRLTLCLLLELCFDELVLLLSLLVNRVPLAEFTRVIVILIRVILTRVFIVIFNALFLLFFRVFNALTVIFVVSRILLGLLDLAVLKLRGSIVINAVLIRVLLSCHQQLLLLLGVNGLLATRSCLGSL